MFISFMPPIWSKHVAEKKRRILKRCQFNWVEIEWGIKKDFEEIKKISDDKMFGINLSKFKKGMNA